MHHHIGILDGCGGEEAPGDAHGGDARRIARRHDPEALAEVLERLLGLANFAAQRAALALRELADTIGG